MSKVAPSQSLKACGSPSVPGNAQFSTPVPNAFSCCNCGHRPLLCVLYTTCTNGDHHFSSSCCRPVFTGGEVLTSTFSLPSSTFLIQVLTRSSSTKAISSNFSAIYSNSTDGLTDPNHLIPPPVSHEAYSHEHLTSHTGSSTGGVNPTPAPAADGDQVWYCCGCSHGPFLVELYASCFNCQHRRCYYCKVD
ncbi:hypothetical protein B0J12DRAFT_694063 [Macrophomina phaseolina]|uniref:Uncharacterized protein n=1 Tax=Macrophomina phaseolina TaxID=35725 RepID=A0ABQ8GSD6_9PEZI|nr:hypothetical protein B0J12DRAFT_694063 [Macrophomina phaseolina]